jgi:PHD/YefM family antitoxin component YafN of YafNO toxin-antitoxin module
MTESCHKGHPMQALNYTTARNSLKSIIDEVCDNNEEVTTKNDKSVVIMSLDEYNRTHAQLKREVKEAMEQIERGEYMGIDEAFDSVIAKYAD